MEDVAGRCIVLFVHFLATYIQLSVLQVSVLLLFNFYTRVLDHYIIYFRGLFSCYYFFLVFIVLFFLCLFFFLYVLQVIIFIARIRACLII